MTDPHRCHASVSHLERHLILLPEPRVSADIPDSCQWPASKSFAFVALTDAKSFEQDQVFYKEGIRGILPVPRQEESQILRGPSSRLSHKTGLGFLNLATLSHQGRLPKKQSTSSDSDLTGEARKLHL